MHQPVNAVGVNQDFRGSKPRQARINPGLLFFTNRTTILCAKSNV